MNLLQNLRLGVHLKLCTKWSRQTSNLNLLHPIYRMKFSTTVDQGQAQNQKSVRKLYEKLVEDGEIRPDPNQSAVINKLEEWQTSFLKAEPRIREFQTEYEKVADFGRAAPRLKRNQVAAQDAGSKLRQRVIEAGDFEDLDNVKYLYIWGEPGSGKTFIGDLLYQSMDLTDAKTGDSKKTKLHYNEFMLQIHQLEHQINKKMRGRATETIGVVGNHFSAFTSFLFIDEFQVLDIADAMILKRLFTAFSDFRMIVMLTSNRPPEDLYMNGLNRNAFLPFIDDLKKNAEIINLSTFDYRLLHAMGMGSYYSPIGPETTKSIQLVWDQLTANAKGTPTVIKVAQGRTLPVKKQAKQVAELTFSELCDDARSSPDYQALAKSFNTVILRGVPQLHLGRRDLMRRFILLIDTLYYNHRNVIIESEVGLEDLFKVDKGLEQLQVHDEEFAFSRCVSRLREMQTKEYQEQSLSASSK